MFSSSPSKFVLTKMATSTTAVRNLPFLVQKRFFNTTITLSTASPSSFTVEHLTKTCGLPLQSALSVSKKFQIDESNLQNSQAVIEFLKSRHLGDAHIAKIIQKCPVVLHCKVQDTLEPKFDYLVENGFVDQLLPQLLIIAPVILIRSLDSQIKPSLELLKRFLGSNEKILASLKRNSWLMSYSFKSALQPNTDFLMAAGLPVDKLAQLMMVHPRAIQIKSDRMVSTVNGLKHLGIEPNDTMFIHALRVMIQMSESSWKKKIEMWKGLGWSEEDIFITFKRYPYILSCSEEKARSLMDFFVNTLKLGHRTIVANPSILKQSFDKRIYPRYNVMKVLKSKKLLKRDKVTATFLIISEEKFLTNYVLKYEDKVPGLLEIYGGIGKTKG